MELEDLVSYCGDWPGLRSLVIVCFAEKKFSKCTAAVVGRLGDSDLQ